MSIVLFSETYGKELIWQRSYPLLPAIYRLATHLRDQGYSVKNFPVWKAPLKTFEEIIKKHVTEDIQIVGISTTLLYDMPIKLFDVEDFKKKLILIKNYSPNCKIILGGSIVERPYIRVPPLSSIMPHIDYYVTGSGEEVLDAILNKLNNNAKLITTNINPTFCSDSIYPHTSFNTSKIEYRPEDYITRQDALGIEYSRGCIFKCSYCNYSKIGKRPGDLIKTKYTVRDELIKNYEEYGIKYYYFTDSLLNEDLEKMEDLADLSASLPFKFRYSAYIRLDLIRKYPKMADLLRDSGLITGIAGIETVNDDSGKSVRKGLGVDRINETLEICNNSWKGSVNINGTFILGLPHDTSDTVHQLKEWFDTPLVRNTIRDVHINSLRISTEDMSDPKHNYTWKPGNKLQGWTNKNGYSFQQAELDGLSATKHFYSKYQVSIFFTGFEVSQILAHAEYYGRLPEIEEFYFTRMTSLNIKNSEDWFKIVQKWYKDRRQEFFKNIL
jgi:hypothetical protein